MIKKDSVWTKQDHSKFVRALNKRLDVMERTYAECQNAFRTTMESLLTKIDKVQYSLDNVAANGRKGLNESIQDIHKAIEELKAEDSKKLFNKPLKEFFTGGNKLGKIVILALVYLLLATVLHAFGIELDFVSLGKMIFGAQ